MTCIYKYNGTAATSTTNTTAPLSQTAATHIVDNVDASEEDIPCDVSTEYRPYRPLPSVITDFIAESMCGILETHQPPKYLSWNFVPLPELVFFVERVTLKAKVDVYTALVALILVSRLKKRLPKNAHGEYGTCHKIFISAILVASKEFMTRQPLQKKEVESQRFYPSTPVTCRQTSSSSPITSTTEKIPLSSSDPNLCLSDSSSEFVQSLSNNILSTTPTSTVSSLSSSSSLSEDEMLPGTPPPASPPSTQHHRGKRRQSIINKKLAEISGIYTLEEVNQMEKSFLKLLGSHNIWVDENDVRNFLEKNKYALGICERSIERNS
ncbi:5001_t:CDS:2 [Funneliformis geosporum]|uniref:19996_t:CDS:1 n=1 Tax=Funneliformis geosporum TaxID=1117311 RepID=A0A9W4SEU1_9GLOM|nr:5001_t:CDS:2 [Funneliformis geosporum]CAI2166453.1 19996_t:CDS:2 [Funneliformis geosporum]